MNHQKYLVPEGKKISLKDYDPEDTGNYKEREEAKLDLEKDIENLAELQDILYAQNIYSLLLVFQAMDAAGKDGVIKHVMSGLNPQGCHVVSFKAPSPEEKDHDYLWRVSKNLPERGRIGIFNRSYYEEVLVVRVHPEILQGQQLPADVKNDKKIWDKRFEEICNFEKYLYQNGVHILKFYLNVSKKEQKKRFLERINTPEKNWKFSATDVKERAHWDEYMKAYEEVFAETSTDYAPWYIIPADSKWFTRALVADIVCKKLESLDLHYPKLSEAQFKELQEAKILLENE